MPKILLNKFLNIRLEPDNLVTLAKRQALPLEDNLQGRERLIAVLNLSEYHDAPRYQHKLIGDATVCRGDEFIGLAPCFLYGSFELCL